MKSYKVTFVADYFVLYTTITEPDVDDDDYIIHSANQLIKEECGLDPQKYAYDIEIEEQ